MAVTEWGKGRTLDELLTDVLPTSLPVTYACACAGVEGELPVTWTCESFDPDAVGDYIFTVGALPEYPFTYLATDDPATVDVDESWLPSILVRVYEPAPSIEEFVLRSGVINGENVHVRSGPGTVFETLAVFSAGTPVTVTGQCDHWYRVNVADNEGAFIDQSLVTILEEQAGEAQPVTGAVNAEDVRIRKGPDRSYDIIKTLSIGTQVTILGRSGNWYYVSTEEAGKGYIWREYVTVGEVEEPEEPVCTCTAACTGEAVNADCPVCAANRADCAVRYVQEGFPKQGRVNVENCEVLVGASTLHLSLDTSVTLYNEADGRYEFSSAEIQKGLIDTGLVTLDPVVPYVCTCTSPCDATVCNGFCPVCAAEGYAACAQKRLTRQTLTAGAADGSTVTVSGSLPDGAALCVELVPLETAQTFVSEGAQILFAYDIKILVGGAEWQPGESLTVAITPPAPIEAPVAVTHVAEDETTGEKTPQPVANVTTTEDGAVEFAAEGFSIYVGTVAREAEYPETIYYNDGFFSDPTTQNDTTRIVDGEGTAFTTIGALIAALTGNTTICLQKQYVLTGNETWTSDYRITIQRIITSRMLTVPYGSTLSLSSSDSAGTIVLDGHYIDTATTGIEIVGVLNIHEGTIVHNFKVSSNGSAIYVHGGTLNMDGGVLTANNAGDTGGAIYSRGTCNISGGSIFGNYATNGGDGIRNTDTGIINVTGGSVHSIHGDVVSGGTTLACYPVAIPSIIGQTEVTAVSVTDSSGRLYAYLCNDVRTDDSGKIYLWLPAGSTVNTVTIPGETIVIDSATVIYLSGTGSDTANGKTIETPVQTFAQAKSLIGTDCIIRICNTVQINGDESWSLAGLGTTKIERSPDFSGNLVSVNSGGSLTLTDIALDGLRISAEGALVHVNGGALTLENGAALQYNYRASGGGAVALSGGALNVSGSATVSNNTGGNVYLATGKTMTVTAALSGSIGVTTQTAPTEIATVTVAEGGTSYTFTDDDLQCINPDNSAYMKARDANNNIILFQARLPYVYLDGVNGDDNNTGGTSTAAVKTFEKATQLLDYHAASGTIFICGTVTAQTGVSSWTLPINATIVRNSGFLGDLIEIPSGATLTLTNIVIDGAGSDVANATGALVKVTNGTLALGDGANLTNNAAKGVDVGINGSVIVGGSATVTGNNKDIYLPNGQKISVNAALTGSIGVETETAPTVGMDIAYAQGSGYTITNNDIRIFSHNNSGNYTDSLDNENTGNTLSYHLMVQPIIACAQAEAGQIYTAELDVPSGMTPNYQWSISPNGTSGWSNITGETNATYTPVIDDIGKCVRVEVTVRSMVYTSDPAPVYAPTLSVTVPLAMTVTVDGAGDCTVSSGSIQNNSLVDVYVESVAYAWNATAAGGYFGSYTAAIATLTLGVAPNTTAYSFTGAIPAVGKPTATNGRVPKKTGSTAGTLALPWSFDLGTGNYIKQAATAGVETRVATVTYTIGYEPPSS